MTMYYHATSQTWFHQQTNKITIPFGQSYLLYKDYGQSVAFPIKIRSKSSVTLVGILTSRNEKGKLLVNARLFKQIQREILQNGGISFIFSLQDIEYDEIDGIVYEPESDSWLETRFPLPSIVYNRIIHRQEEKSETFQDMTTYFAQHQIPFFNPCFMDKWELYEALKQNPILSPCLPFTQKIENKNTLVNMLTTYSSAYVKQITSSQGEGISLIKLNPDSSVLRKNASSTIKFPSISELWREHENWASHHIIQEHILTDMYQGHKYDLRVMAHSDGKLYNVTGIGIRLAGKEKITTHVKRGGSVLPFEKIKHRVNEQKVQEIVTECGKCLSDRFGWMGEFTLDLGLSTEGDLFLFEINSKPMKFDEEGIEEERIKSLVKIFTSN
ncbi:YheC/YheD family protein [Bacillus spongiae]|uniref:YheC/YheD family protein n=1 Tax=Bacillus spongiae TaxID=2683610 RepID=A0ABU8HAS0_9BACI